MKAEGQLFLLIICLCVFIIWLIFRKRSNPLSGQDVAHRLSLDFSPDKTNEIQPALSFINRLTYGKRHYAKNIFSGAFKGAEIKVFDFIYEVEVMNGKSSSYVEDPYSFYSLDLNHCFDEVTIYKEGLISKLKQLSGGNDIDFESAEFSRKFRVRSPNPKFAYDFCNARMINYLLENRDLSIEIDQNILCISFDRPLQFEEVEKNLNRLVRIRELMPDYLFEDTL